MICWITFLEEWLNTQGANAFGIDRVVDVVEVFRHFSNRQFHLPGKMLSELLFWSKTLINAVFIFRNLTFKLFCFQNLFHNIDFTFLFVRPGSKCTGYRVFGEKSQSKLKKHYKFVQLDFSNDIVLNKKIFSQNHSNWTIFPKRGTSEKDCNRYRESKRVNTNRYGPKWIVK